MNKKVLRNKSIQELNKTQDSEILLTYFTNFEY